MPMQRGMNFSIRWKRQAGELMGGKKDRERFSIKFNENDPAHDAVIRLLEKQGPRSKAQFLVNAILHYINCPETPDIAIPQTIDRAVIEEIIAEILGRKEDIYVCTPEFEAALEAWKETKQEWEVLLETLPAGEGRGNEGTPGGFCVCPGETSLHSGLCRLCAGIIPYGIIKGK